MRALKGVVSNTGSGGAPTDRVRKVDAGLGTTLRFLGRETTGSEISLALPPDPHFILEWLSLGSPLVSKK